MVNPSGDAAVFDGFGYNANSATAGQTFVVTTASTISEFSFPVIASSGVDSSSAAAVGALYAWDEANGRAVGLALASQKIPLTSALTQLTASFPPVTVAAGTYVVFFTTSGLWSQDPELIFQWRKVAAQFLEGHLVYYNNGNDATQLTVSTWDGSGVDDQSFACSICFVT